MIHVRLDGAAAGHASLAHDDEIVAFYGRLDTAGGQAGRSHGEAVALFHPKLGETITTESGLVYKFTQLGKGPQPQTGDLMVIHGIGTLADGKEFWNTRTDGSPYEYTLGVDSVIRGFSEGMRHVREGDRIIITMTPELAYGARERTGIPANSTLVFDYEILAVKPLAFVKLMREAIAAGTVDEAIAKAKATPNLKEYYVSASSIQAAANAANRKEPGSNEKVLELGLTLLPEAYQLHQTLARIADGSVIGEMSLLMGNAARSATAVAATDAQLLRVPADRFGELVRRDRVAALKIVFNLAQVMSRRLLLMNEKLVEQLDRGRKKEELTEFQKILSDGNLKKQGFKKLMKDSSGKYVDVLQDK